MRRCHIAATILLLIGASAGVAEPAPLAMRPAPPLTLERLMDRLSEITGLRARFEETRNLALLREPLASEGMLYFAPPDRLARHTELPSKASLVIDGDRLLLRDAVGVDRVDLGASETARALVDNFVVLFTGDLEALEARYRIEFVAEGESWRMLLRPRSVTMGALIESIAVEGDGVELRHIVVLETTGDRTTTRFDQIETRHVFSTAETLAVFSVEGPPAGE